MLYAIANLLLTESIHGNIEKVGWAQIGRQQPLPFAHLGRTLQLRKKIFGTRFLRTQVFSTKVFASRLEFAHVVEARLIAAQFVGKQIFGAKIFRAKIFRPEVVG